MKTKWVRDYNTQPADSFLCEVRLNDKKCCGGRGYAIKTGINGENLWFTKMLDKDPLVVCKNHASVALEDYLE